MREAGKGGFQPLSSAILTKAKPQRPSEHPPSSPVFQPRLPGDLVGGCTEEVTDGAPLGS